MMIRYFLPILCIGAALLAQESSPASAPAATAIVGIWEGAIDTGQAKLRVAVHVREADGKLAGTFDSIDQGAKDLKIDDVKFENGTFSFKLKIAYASYSGKMAGDGASIDGQWKQGGAVPLVLKKVEKASELERPQTPKKPYPYEESEVAYSYRPGAPLADSFKAVGTPDEKERITLAGTLTMPKGDGPFAAAILITGSGQQDRDETLLGHKPFLVLADHLTRAGIAVLRVDDRGAGKSTGDFKNATSADFADDVRAGLRFLRQKKSIDPKRVGVIGHSEGGIIAPMVAATDPDLAFAILLAGPGVDGGEILKLQGRAIAKSTGQWDPSMDKMFALNDELYAIMRREKDQKKMVDAIRTFVGEWVDKEGVAATQGLGKEKFIETAVAQCDSVWFHYFVAYDPRPALTATKCPVLALNGALDKQVDAEQNLPEIEKALKAGGAKDVTIKRLDGLNHLFQHAKTGSPNEYQQITETFAPEALDTISAWLVARFAR